MDILKTLKPLFVFLLFFQPVHPISAQYVLGIAQENADVLSYKNGSFEGEMAESVRCVVHGVNAFFEVIVAPHARILKMLEAGEIDVATPFVKIRERDEYAFFTGLLWPVNMRVVHDDSFTDVKNEAFYNRIKKIGYVVKRGTYTDALILQILGLDKGYFDFNKHQVLTWQDALLMVSLDRAAITIVPESIVESTSSDLLNGLNTSAVLTINASFYVSDKQKQLHALFQKETQACAVQM